MSAPRLILTCGLPGAGKTTLANRLAEERGAVRLTKDEWLWDLGSSPWDGATGVKLERRLWLLAQRSDVCMLICMQSTSVRIDAATHEDLKRLAAELHTTVGNTVSLAVRALRQDRVGADLTAPLREDESAWLDAELG